MITNQQSNQTYDEVDMAILTYLQKDSTITNSKLAYKVNLSPSACLGRTKRLREAGILKQFIAIVDEQKIGLEAVTFVFVSLEPHDRETTEAFLTHIRAIPNIMECHNISGVHDYLLKIVSPSITAYRNFVIDTLIGVPGVGKVETSVVLSSDKQSYQLPLSDAKIWKKPAEA
jgi:Lrp/AsnC family transcriptional regulator